MRTLIRPPDCGKTLSAMSRTWGTTVAPCRNAPGLYPAGACGSDSGTAMNWIRSLTAGQDSSGCGFSLAWIKRASKRFGGGIFCCAYEVSSAEASSPRDGLCSSNRQHRLASPPPNG